MYAVLYMSTVCAIYKWPSANAFSGVLDGDCVHYGLRRNGVALENAGCETPCNIIITLYILAREAAEKLYLAFLGQNVAHGAASIS